MLCVFFALDGVCQAVKIAEMVRHRTGAARRQVDLRHTDESEGQKLVKVGIDLSEFYKSVEWDILDVPAIR